MDYIPKKRTFWKALQIFDRALRTGRLEVLEELLSPELEVSGFDRLVISNTAGRAKVLIWVYGLHRVASDITVEALGGWPTRDALSVERKLKLSGVWRSPGGPFEVGEAFTLTLNVLFEFREGMITKLTERR